MRLTDNFYF